MAAVKSLNTKVLQSLLSIISQFFIVMLLMAERYKNIGSGWLMSNYQLQSIHLKFVFYLSLSFLMKTKLKIKWVLLAITFLPHWVSAQKGMDAVYSSFPGMVGAIYCFHQNNTYHYYAGSCTQRWADSGYYIIHHDTITFNSVIKELPASDRKVAFYVDVVRENITDSIWIEITNRTSVPSTFYFTLSFKDSVLIFSDSLPIRKHIKIGLPKQLLSPNLFVELKVNDAVQSIALNGHISFFIKIHEWIEYKPNTYSLCLKRNKVYPIIPNIDYDHSKYFLRKKRGREKRSLEKMFYHPKPS
jgi:hypothetical protein